MVRAGVPERVAMAVSGHRTRRLFDRYIIVSGRDLADAAERTARYVAERTIKRPLGTVQKEHGQNTDNRASGGARKRLRRAPSRRN
jgi:hypothetical protein